MNDPFSPYRYHRHQEIDLIELARILVRRWVLGAVAFVLVMLVGAAVVLFKPPVHDFTTTYQLAKRSADAYLEEPATTVASLQAHLIPMIRARYVERTGDELSFEMLARNPSSTGLVILGSRVSLEHAPEVEAAHEAVISALQEVEAEKLANLRTRLEEELKVINQSIEELRASGGRDVGMALATSYEKRIEVEAALAALRSGEVVDLARQSLRQKGVTPPVLIAVALGLAVFLALFTVYFAEFCARVRQRG